ATTANPSRMKLRLVSGSVGDLAPPANAGPSDPVLVGATLRVVTNGFDQTYPLPAAKWSYIGRAGSNQGYRYRDRLQTAGPIIGLVMRKNGLNVASGRGQGLAFVMPSDPDPARTVLHLGPTKYCTSFGGNKRYVADTMLYRARVAPAPGACPP